MSNYSLPPLSEPHPVKGVLALRRLTNRYVAAQYGCSEGFVCRVLNGRQKPSRGFRSFLSGLLGIPEHHLFYGVDPPPRPERDDAGVPRAGTDYNDLTVVDDQSLGQKENGRGSS